MTDKINDGGPAFPTEPKYTKDFQLIERDYSGLTKRGWFAGMALQGMLCNPVFGNKLSDAEVLSKAAFATADAMIKECEK